MEDIVRAYGGEEITYLLAAGEVAGLPGEAGDILGFGAGVGVAEEVPGGVLGEVG